MTGPLPPSLDPIARPLAWVYRGVIGARNASFGRVRQSRTVPVPVISIGNLTVGGTGKTPHVQWTARTLLAAGRSPAICLRGYARGDGPSDEAMEHRRRVPDARVVVHPRRYEAIRRALADDPSIDCCVLDDGFQHRQLARDLDIVLLDSTRASLADRMLPAGWLREPITALARADAVVVTRATAVDDELAAAIEQLSGHRPIAWTRHVWAGLDVHEPGPVGIDAIREPVSILAGVPVAVMAGIGHPASVVRTATEAGARVVHEESVRDHHRYDAAMLGRAMGRAVAAGAEFVLVTRKDWVKLERILTSDDAPAGAGWLPVVVPDLDVGFVDGEDALRDRVLAAAGGPIASADDRSDAPSGTLHP
ncbi:MAG: tetraacyldisaccharide 4'-kinase [Phycisphaerales bacterium]